MLRISKFSLLLITVISSIVIGMQPVLAGQKGLTRAESVDVFSGNENYAVIIGVNKYDEIGNLNYAVEDAMRLTRFFEEQGYNVKTLTNFGATKNRVLKHLRNVAEIAGNPGGTEGNVVFAFSGHGFRHKGQNYLATPETNPSDISGTALSLKEVSGMLEQAEVRQRVLFIDACRNDPSKGRVSKSRTFTADKSAEGLAILYSTRADRLSWEDNKLQQGVFSHFLIKGLKGGAAAGDGYVSFDRLQRYVANRVKKYVFNNFDEVQIPYIGGERTGEFILAKGPGSGGLAVAAVQTHSVQTAPVQTPVASSRPEIKMGSLTLDVTPSEARVRIMNIGPKYHAGIELALNENYDVLVSHPGYQSWRQTIRLSNANQRVQAMLKKSPKPQVAKKQWFEPEMVLIPAGSFRMGDLVGKGVTDEKPVHAVNLKSFLMGKYEVTFDEYDAYVKATGADRPDDYSWGRRTRPVINVSWDDAKGYIKWLNKQTGKRYRLPSESEWEYAARAGTTTRYSWGDKIEKNRANCNGCGSQWDNKKTALVGRFSKNEFGLYDVHGNVREWVEDRWHDSYDGAPNDGSAWLTGGSSGRVLRGGAWSSIPARVRSALRNRDFSVNRDYFIGFRLAQDR